MIPEGRVTLTAWVYVYRRPWLVVRKVGGRKTRVPDWTVRVHVHDPDCREWRDWTWVPESERRGWTLGLTDEAKRKLAQMGCTGHRVRITVTLPSRPPWDRLGTFGRRPRFECADPDEHVLAALAGLSVPTR